MRGSCSNRTAGPPAAGDDVRALARRADLATPSTLHDTIESLGRQRVVLAMQLLEIRVARGLGAP